MLRDLWRVYFFRGLLRFRRVAAFPRLRIRLGRGQQRGRRGARARGIALAPPGPVWCGARLEPGRHVEPDRRRIHAHGTGVGASDNRGARRCERADLG